MRAFAGSIVAPWKSSGAKRAREDVTVENRIGRAWRGCLIGSFGTRAVPVSL